MSGSGQPPNNERLTSLTSRGQTAPDPKSTVWSRYNAMLSNRPASPPTYTSSIPRPPSLTEEKIQTKKDIYIRLKQEFANMTEDVLRDATLKTNTYDAAVQWLKGAGGPKSSKVEIEKRMSIREKFGSSDALNKFKQSSFLGGGADKYAGEPALHEPSNVNIPLGTPASSAAKRYSKAGTFMQYNAVTGKSHSSANVATPVSTVTSKPVSMNFKSTTAQTFKNKVVGRSAPASAPQFARYEQPTKRRKVKEEWDDSDGGSDVEDDEEVLDYDFLDRCLDFINTATKKDIIDIAACEDEAAEALVQKRPFSSLHQARLVDIGPKPTVATGKGAGRGRRQKKAAGDKIVDEITTTLKGYEAVDSLIQTCDQLGREVSSGMKSWGVDMFGVPLENGSEAEPGTSQAASEGANGSAKSAYFHEKPSLLAEDVQLKDYQQVGINWLSLLYEKKLSCILADEMGLGKTCQVISFLAHIKESGGPGPHLVVVPASTLENWLREFQRFCPALKVEPYYGSMPERVDLREQLAKSSFDVLVTTYNLACGSKQDTGFLRSYDFNCCIYDEGHMLKNSSSERYAKLMRLHASFRILLTGTPLQNNLKELVSLLAFILPQIFSAKKEDLASIFKHKAKTERNASKSKANSVASSTVSSSVASPAAEESSESTPVPEDHNPLLSEQRITKAKTMMGPFVLRRRKDQVLKHLPPKTHEIKYCEMTPDQKELYDAELDRQKKHMERKAMGEKVSSREITNVLMQLRKASIHPLLFRRIYDDATIKKMARAILKEERYLDANETFIYEDMGVMSDFELNRLCETFPTTLSKYCLKEKEWSNSGKVQVLKEMLVKMKADGDRVLIFSQFTQMLDILERVLGMLNIKFVRMDGSTAVEIRQDMIDKYQSDSDITVFLLSTKAGGFGINLTSANKVIIFDLSFNPHDDKQAEDRAHRVGQTRPVEVIRLVMKSSVEENILTLANTKLALDRSVSDEAEGKKVEEEAEDIVADMVFG